MKRSLISITGLLLIETTRRIQLNKQENCSCGGRFVFTQYCGAKVCNDCNNHLGYARCYCGWSESGGNGYQELIDLGETIEP